MTLKGSVGLGVRLPGRAALAAGVVAVLVSSCGGREHASPYAAAVFDDPPIYCYRTLGDPDCYRRPLAGAEQRLVNYYGPPPDDYGRPEPAPAPRLHPPPPGRPVPDTDVQPAPLPAPTPAPGPAGQPTPLFPADPSPAAKAAAGSDAATPTAAPGAPESAPLVIEVEGR